jgi:hypothetical protein
MNEIDVMHAWGRVLGAAVVVLGAAGCGDRSSGGAEPSAAPSSSAPQGGTAGTAATTVDLDDASACASCHAQVVEEWRESMHAQAHHETDPIYGALRAFRMTKEGPGLGTKCAHCHHPRELAELDGPRATQGVGCASCHQIGGVDLEGGKAGAKALLAGAPGVLRGPHDVAAGASPAHGTGPALSALADGKTICLACHQEEKNKAGVATCTTGIEHATSGDSQSCVSCHMPEIDAPSGSVGGRETHRSHAFLGPHRAWQKGDPSFVASGVELGGELTGDTVVATLRNRSGHGFPSGFPGRMAVLVMRGLDRSGTEIWRNIHDDPMKEHAAAVLNKVYVDADDKPVLPPYGVKLARDSRLTTEETRSIRIIVPPTVVKVELSLSMWLLPPMAAKTIGLADRPEAKPVVIATHTIARR